MSEVYLRYGMDPCSDMEYVENCINLFDIIYSIDEKTNYIEQFTTYDDRYDLDRYIKRYPVIRLEVRIVGYEKPHNAAYSIKIYQSNTPIYWKGNDLAEISWVLIHDFSITHSIDIYEENDYGEILQKYVLPFCSQKEVAKSNDNIGNKKVSNVRYPVKTFAGASSRENYERAFKEIVETLVYKPLEKLEQTDNAHVSKKKKKWCRRS